ncbi:MAG: energy-coupling factor ABC transporter ATP-binding protein [Synergistaceae bacterium]
MCKIFEIKNLLHSYDNKKNTLEIESLDIEKGTIVGFVGSNGSGKTTLLKILSFLEPYSKGEIKYNGERVKNERELRKEITYLLQSPYLLKRNVYENIAYGIKLRKGKNIEAKVREALEKVGLLYDEFAQREWSCLSGGEVQRIALASRLVIEPKVLILDEPTANVDSESAELIKKAIEEECKQRGTTVIIATHDTEWLEKIAKTTIYLKNGKIEKIEKNEKN